MKSLYKIDDYRPDAHDLKSIEVDTHNIVTRSARGWMAIHRQVSPSFLWAVGIKHPNFERDCLPRRRAENAKLK